jgi:cell division transport system permease protein
MQFRKELDTEAYTFETRYVTADEAAEQLKKDLGEDFLGVLGSNPLLPSVELRLNADLRPDGQLEVDRGAAEEGPARAGGGLQRGRGREHRRQRGQAGACGLGFTALLLIIAVALINNTIRLAIYSKRFLIRTMHLVGATQWFIKKPFLGQSLWQGIIGAVLAIGLLVGCCGWRNTTCRTCWPSPMPRWPCSSGRAGTGHPDLPALHMVRGAALPSHEFRGPALLS